MNTLSNTYTQAAQGYEPLKKRITYADPGVVGIDEKGTIYFALDGEIVSIDTEGRRRWMGLSSKGLPMARLAVDRGEVIFLLELKEKIQQKIKSIPIHIV